MPQLPAVIMVHWVTRGANTRAPLESCAMERPPPTTRLNGAARYFENSLSHFEIHVAVAAVPHKGVLKLLRVRYGELWFLIVYKQ
jgi:hypothetical protein